MRLRVLLEPHHGASYPQILALARATEEAGFDAFFRSGHYLGIDPNDTGYQPTDSWTTLAGLAVQTGRVRLGTLMTASTYRRPGPLAVTVATVDAMSGGRGNVRAACARIGRDPATLRYSAVLPAVCGASRAEASARAARLGDAGARMLRTGITGTPGEIAGRVAQLAAAGADTVYFHLYDVSDTDHVRLLGSEVLPRC
jgi:alkanesulfonate monooxygenase SsuD/methylene tetrahydromethanopterin reductase-like flavin-dependent oxidoreductase (luciferase family)